MGKGLKPDFFLETLFSICPDDLNALCIKGLLLDIDNTLVPNYVPDADDRVLSFVSGMQASGIKLALLSNASPHRISLFNRALGLPAVEGALKPFRAGYEKGLELLGLPAGEVLMAGDQLFTDILGANACGIRSLLVAPMHKVEPWYVSLKRLVEKLFLGGMVPAPHLPRK